MKTLIQQGIIAAYYPDESAYWQDGLLYIPDAIVRYAVRNAGDNPAPDPCESNPLEDVKSWLKQTINLLSASRMDNGFMFNGARFQSDNEAMQNITGTGAAVGMGIPLPPGFAWRDADNTMHPMDAAAFMALYGTALQWRNTLYTLVWVMKSEIDAAQDLPVAKAIVGGAKARLDAI